MLNAEISKSPKLMNVLCYILTYIQEIQWNVLPKQDHSPNSYVVLFKREHYS